MYSSAISSVNSRGGFKRMFSSRPAARDAGQNLSKPWANALGLEPKDARREAPLVSENVPMFRGQSATQYATDGSQPAAGQPVLRVVEEPSPFDAPVRY